jgi:hypothetical protein
MVSVAWSRLPISLEDVDNEYDAMTVRLMTAVQKCV